MRDGKFIWFFVMKKYLQRSKKVPRNACNGQMEAVSVTVAEGGKTMKNVQVPFDLFLALLSYHLLDNHAQERNFMARSDGVDRTSARNVNLSAGQIGNVQRHNEREKESYTVPTSSRKGRR